MCTKQRWNRAIDKKNFHALAPSRRRYQLFVLTVLQECDQDASRGAGAIRNRIVADQMVRSRTQSESDDFQV